MSEEKLDTTKASLETFSNLNQNDAKVISASPAALPDTAGGPADRAEVSDVMAKREEGVGNGSVEGEQSRSHADNSQQSDVLSESESESGPKTAL